MDIHVLHQQGHAQVGPLLEDVAHPFGRDEANLFFNVSAKRYEHGSVIVTSNLRLSQWSTFADEYTLTAALLDRLLHHAHIVQIAGNSYHFKREKGGRTSIGNE